MQQYKVKWHSAMLILRPYMYAQIEVPELSKWEIAKTWLISILYAFLILSGVVFLSLASPGTLGIAILSFLITFFVLRIFQQ